MAKAEHTITIVANNEEKRLSYKENFDRYNKAKKSEFYLECLWILYAMLEDRTSALLYHLGLTGSKNINSVTETKKIKQEICQIFKIDKEKPKYKFSKISDKLSRIYEIITWSKTSCDNTSDYQKVLKKALEKVSDDENIINSVNYLNNEWREKRNQLIHSLFNKSYNAVSDELQSLVESGYIAIRNLDNAVKKVERFKIRNRFNIQ